MRGKPSVFARGLAGAAVLAGLGAAAARASDLDQFGFGARGAAMGSAMSGVATEFDATYYNPAGLALARDSAVVLGFSYAGYLFDYESEARGRAADERTERQQPLSAFTLGLNARLGREGWPGRLGVGFGLFLPTRQLVGTQVQTAPGEPQFFLYGERRDKVGVLPAVAVRILPWQGEEGTPKLSLGLGATVLSDLQGSFVFDLSGASTEPAVRTEIKLTHDVAPNAGIFFVPAPWLTLGVAYRGELSLKAELPVTIDLDGDGVGDFPLDLEAVTLFQPQQLALGLAIDPVPALTIALDLTWQNWSAFEDPFITVRPVLGQTDPDFDDALVPRAGIEWRASDAVALRAGYWFQPTPIPEQRGETNLLDNDKHVFTLGVGWTWWSTHERFFRSPDGTIQARSEDRRVLSLDAFVQWHHLVERRVDKRDPAASGGVGASHRHGGEILHGGVQLAVHF
ncbi:MAG: hypothetical protein KatS3mg102_2898 [Planctomycetota bacterium]|nr:MAG: hypothetical protein KatS3mg102_2898 [Planctomycetota bacterium]